MFKIQNRKQLREYILQELGAPVINVELAEVQVDNAINKAINFFIERHDDGIEEIFLTIDVDSIVRENAYVELDDSIVGVSSILDLSASETAGEQLADLNHLIAKSDIFSGTSINMGGMIRYVRSQQTIQNIQYFFEPFYDFEFNKITNRLYFRNNLTNIESLGAIVYRAIDPDYDYDIFNDEWIKRYATALAHRQWGVNLNKYTGMDLPGQGQLNGESILQEGKELVEKALEEFEMTYGTPPLPRVE